jgi:NAD(P)-dependent dehydrogenase (short-subunit alcohol dehydrogenase family)
LVRSAVVLGARRTGGAVVDRLLADGWRVTAVARSPETLQAVRDRGARAVGADASDPAELCALLDAAGTAQGGLDLVVNALAGRIPDGPFGGGPVADADLATFRSWGVAVAEQAFTFLHAGAVALRATGGGTLIQLTGGSSLRAAPGRGPWAAGAFATRALVHAAANELAPEGIHVALLVVDGTVQSNVERTEIAAAVAHLAAPGELRRAHELHLARAGTPWQP